MPAPTIHEMEPRQRRRVLAAALLRALLTAIVLVALYYLLPLDNEWRLSSAMRAVVGAGPVRRRVDLADPEGPVGETSGDPSCRGSGHDASPLPAVVRDDVLPDVSPRIGSLQPRASVAHGRLVSHRDHLRHGGLRRHIRGQPSRTCGGDVPDAPRSRDPRCRDQRVRQRGEGGSTTAVRDRRSRVRPTVTSRGRRWKIRREA